MNRYLALTIKYNRSTKQYEVESYEVPHLAISATTCTVINSAQGLAFALGQLVAGHFGPKEPAKRAAIANTLLELLNSDVRADTSSFGSACPIIAL